MHRCQPHRCPGRNNRAKGKTRQPQISLRPALPDIRDNRRNIVNFAMPTSVLAGAATDTTKIEPLGRHTHIVHSPRQRMYNFIQHRALMLGVGMTQNRNPVRRYTFRNLKQRFQVTLRALNSQCFFLGCFRHVF